MSGNKLIILLWGVGCGPHHYPKGFLLNIIYCTVYFSTYVAVVGTLTGNQSGVTIGTGESTQYGSTTYVDQRLNGNTDYFVIIRLFSMIDASVRTNEKDN